MATSKRKSSTKRKSRKKKRRSKSICKKRVSDKIRINMDEYKQGKFSSRQQAIAVSYSQVSKKYPYCRRYLKLSPRKRSTKKLDKGLSTRPYRVTIKPSTRSEKKYMATFYDKDNNKIRTTHFGAYGMSDFTKHRDPERKQRYIKRHKKRENWNDPMSAGALSRYILWGEPTLRESIKKYKKRFKLK